MGKKIDEPLILRESHYTEQDIDALKHEQHVFREVDILPHQLAELFEVQNAQLINDPEFKEKQQSFVSEQNKPTRGNWIYYSWSGVLVHTVSESEYFRLRTNRNKNLITEEEQERLYNTRIAIAGLSVGSSLAVGMAYQGIGRHMCLAEFDTLETTNLNRIRANMYDVGTRKIDVVAQQIYQINPYNDLELFKEGLTRDNLDSFAGSAQQKTVIFEIIDDFEMKIILRQKARALGIPVISYANLADSILLDVERYDLDPKWPLFNGVLGNLPEHILENPNEDKNKYAVQMVGIENVPQRALDSVRQIGKTLVGRPQLPSTVAISAALGSYIVRRIVVSNDLPSGRTKIQFSDILKS